jgi:hypothetical protein
LTVFASICAALAPIWCGVDHGGERAILTGKRRAKSPLRSIDSHEQAKA